MMFTAQESIQATEDRLPDLSVAVYSVHVSNLGIGGGRCILFKRNQTAFEVKPDVVKMPHEV
jgi:hypothetical protein